MQHVPLGRSGLAVSRLGYGCMSLSYEPRHDRNAEALLDRAMDLGVTFFDTADKYGKGHNEKLVGRALGHRADDIVLASKFGFVGSPEDPKGVDGRPEHVQAACEASLRRLGMEVIDLYYLHRVDPAVPIEETVGTMAELVTAGKVRALGLSEAAPATIRRAHAVHPIAALQTEYSLWSREPEQHLLDTCRELGITFVAYSPLGIGFLTGRVTAPEEAPKGSRLGRSERIQRGNLERNLALVAHLASLADALGCTPGQVALAWVLARGIHVVPIPGTRNISHLEENLGALQVELRPDHVHRLDRLFHADAPAGRRKSTAGMAIVNR
ncbi:MAG: aldo/keto reductase [Nitriliruptorales bacterium]|nr:aldo/keto reductase [Nitriliruptorales bacterium]